MSAGLLKMPLVMRVSVGNKYGAQHSQDWSALVHHIPGLKVYFPTTPTDAKGMLNLALAGTDPVVFLESQLLYDMGEQFEPGGVPEGYYETPEGLSLIHISEPTRLGMISYAVFCLKKKKRKTQTKKYNNKVKKKYKKTKRLKHR